jgi:annexin D
LLAYVSTPRHEGPEVNREIAEKDAKVLYKAGEKKLGTDEKTFVQIFSERSAAHLAAVSSYYHDMYGHSLKKVLLITLILFVQLHLSIEVLIFKLKSYQAVKNEASGNFGNALLTIIQCATNPGKYFAKVSIFTSTFAKCFF